MGLALDSGRGLRAEMNVVPLIDVLLVVLILFMVLTPLRSWGLPARVPLAGSDAVPAPQRVVVVGIGNSGSLRIDGEPVAWSELAGRLREVFSSRIDKVAFVRGEDRVPFGSVARAISLMREAGIEQVGLIPASYLLRQ